MRPQAKLRLGLLAVVVLMGVVLWVGRTVGFQFFHPENIAGLGWPAAVGYGMMIMVFGGLGVPPVLLIVPAAAVWSFQVAFAQAMLGGMGGAWLGFLLSRHFLRETVDPRIPSKIRRYEHRLETHGFSTVLVMRLMFYLFPPINWMLGISHISTATFLGATCLGMLPGTLVYLLTGRGLIGVIAALSPPQAAGIAAVALAALLAWWRWAVTTGEN